MSWNPNAPTSDPQTAKATVAGSASSYSTEQRDFAAGVSNVRWLDAVQARSLEWLWEPYIPVGRLTLIEGDPGEGKSWLTLAVAASLSTGRPLPGGGVAETSNVLIFTAEDNLADTVRPRLDSLGSDPARIAAFDGLTLLDEEGIQEIAYAIEHVGPRLVVIDPLVAYLGGSVDMHRANETREVMARLAELAETYSVSVVCVRHLRKAVSGRAIHQGLGSIDLTAASRSVLLVGSNPADRTEKALFQIKNNLSPTARPVGFRISTEGFEWLPHTRLSVSDVLASEAQDSGGRIDEAEGFLVQALADGPRRSLSVKEEAREQGIASRTLDRAKAQLGVVADRVGYGASGAWYWSLPGTGSSLSATLPANSNLASNAKYVGDPSGE